MVIAGIMNLKDSAKQAEEPVKKRSKKIPEKKKENFFVNWMLGGSSNMDLKKQGRLRIQIGVVLIIFGLIIAGTFIF